MDNALLNVAELLKIEFATLSTYAGRVQTMRFGAGGVIYGPEKSFDGVYVVVDGLAKTVLELRDREVVTSIATRGDVLGTDALHSPTFVTEAVAVTTLTVVKIPEDVFSELIRSNDEFREALHRKLSAAIAEAFELIELLAKSRAEARLAFFFLKVASKVAQGRQEQEAFNIGFTRGEIGRYLGLKAETVSRRIATFAESGYVKVQGKTISIKNRPALERLRSGKTVH